MSDVTVIIGSDDYLVCEAARKVLGDGTGVEVFDSLNSSNADLQLADLGRVRESLLTPPFLEPRKVTWWKNACFLPAGGSQRLSEDVKEALLGFAGFVAAVKLPENHRFLITAPALMRNSEVARRLCADATLVNLSTEKGWKANAQAQSRAMEFAAGLGLAFAPGVERRFVELVGADCRTMISELTKLRDYLGDGNTLITGDDVAAISSPGIGVEANPWEVTNAIAARKTVAALENLRKFELESGFEVFMSTIIEGQFRRMYEAKRDSAAAHPEWTLGELRVARARFAKLRERVVGGTNCGAALVVTELVRALRKDVR